MSSVFSIVLPVLRCTSASCGHMIVSWSKEFRSQLPRGAQPLEALDRFGHRFLEPEVTDYLCPTLRETFHRGALKTRYLDQLMRRVRGAMPVGLGTASPLAMS